MSIGSINNHFAPNKNKINSFEDNVTIRQIGKIAENINTI